MSFVMIEGKSCSHVIEKVNPYKKNPDYTSSFNYLNHL